MVQFYSVLALNTTLSANESLYYVEDFVHRNLVNNKEEE
jgi:hypothetical protein